METLVSSVRNQDNTILKEWLYKRDRSVLPENKPGGDGFSLLHWAVEANNLEAIQILLINKIYNVDIQDESGCTPLHWAATESDGMKRVECAKELLKYSAKVNSNNERKETPLHIACASGNLELVQLLVSKGSNINATSAINFTPLHSAASKSRAVIIAYLVVSDVDTTIRDFNGQTALELAVDTHPNLAIYFNKEDVAKKFTFTPVVDTSRNLQGEIDELQNTLKQKNESLDRLNAIKENLSAQLSETINVIHDLESNTSCLQRELQKK